MSVFQKKYIPNWLSVLRILLLPLYLFLFFQNYPTTLPFAACILIFCAATDALDGYLARKNNWITNVGKLLDPLADKLATLCALGALSARGLFPLWITLLVLVKEVGMVLTASFLLRKKNIVVASVWYGKMATIVFYLVVLALHFFPQMPDAVKLALWILLAASMAVAALLYLFVYLKKLPPKEGQDRSTH